VLDHGKPIDDTEHVDSGRPHIWRLANCHQRHKATISAAGDADLLGIDITSVTLFKERAMPYLSIQTNVAIGEEAQKRLLAEASQIVATGLNKPEKYVMVAWTPAPTMTFDSDPNGTAFLELRSIGIPEPSRQKLPGMLAKCMSEHLGIEAERVYLVMMDVPGKYWAEGEQTFG
jgi:phenylpyruvate tautomerase